MVTINVLAIAVAFAVCIPSAIISFGFWLLEKRMDKRQKETEAKQEARQKKMDERDAKRQESEFITLKCVIASMSLGEATARAVERIPDAHCNGDMHAALDYATKVKREQRKKKKKEGIGSIYQNQKEDD